MAAQRRGFKLDHDLFQKSKTGLLKTELWERCLIWNPSSLGCKVALLKLFPISVSNFEISLLLTSPQGSREAPSVTQWWDWLGLLESTWFGRWLWQPFKAAGHSPGARKQRREMDELFLWLCLRCAGTPADRTQWGLGTGRQEMDSTGRALGQVLVTLRCLYPPLLPVGQFSSIQLYHRTI